MSRRDVRDSRAFGLTLLEVLLAVALATLVGLVATRLLLVSRTSEGRLSETSDHARALDLAADLLGDELRRAGSEPFPPPSGGGLDRGEPSLELLLGSGAYGDGIRVRYVDERVRGKPVARDLRFDVAVDGRGVGQLYRATASGNRQPLVQGIDGLRIVGWVDATGMHPRGALVPGPLRPWLLLLEVEAPGTMTRRVAAPLPSRPQATVVPVS